MLLKSFSWNAFSSLAVGGCQLLQVLIVGYFLTAEQLGVMALAQVVTGVGYLLMDSGLSNLLIQKKDIQDHEKSTIFLTSFFLSLLVIITFNLISDFVGIFYESEELSSIIVALSVVFFLAPIQQFFSGLYQRALLFSFMAIVDIFGSIIGLFIVGYSALSGEGVYSLVYGVFAVTLSKVIAYTVLGPKRVFVKKVTFDIAFFKSSIKFGLYQLGERFVNLLSTQIDSLLIGKLFGTDVLGVYNLAKTLVLKGSQLFYSVISKTLFPIFSKINDDIGVFQSMYQKTFTIIMVVTTLLFSLLIIALTTVPLMQITDDSKWSNVIPLMPYFCILSVTMISTYVASSALLSKGKVSLLFNINLASLIGNVFVVYFLSSYSLQFVLVGLIAVTYVISSFFYGIIVSRNYLMEFKKHLVITSLALIFPIITLTILI
jgi:O-antigen/teichoic acid export membrane protein